MVKTTSGTYRTASLHVNHIEINIVYMGVCQKMVSHREAYCIYIVGPCSYRLTGVKTVVRSLYFVVENGADMYIN